MYIAIDLALSEQSQDSIVKRNKELEKRKSNSFDSPGETLLEDDHDRSLS